VRRRLAALVLLGLSACSSAPSRKGTAPGPSASPAPAASPAPSGSRAGGSPQSREARIIARTLTRVSALRQVEATRAVPGKTLPRGQLIARVKEHVAREIPPDAIEKEGLILRLFGFVPDQFDYAKEMFALLESNLAGFYEPEDGTMYMAGDLDGLNAEATLAHELVHALQDQHWDLKKRSKYRPGESDKSSALAALAEGDATSAMADYVVAKMDASKTALDVSEDLFTEQVLGTVSGGPGTNTPHVMKTSLIAPYVDGLVFVNALRRKGGWTLVNRAWSDIPKTTEQILHVEKWEAKEPAVEVGAPTAAALGPGWVKADEDTYGEQGVRLMFEEWMSLNDAKVAASAWGGDRGTLVTNGAKAALALRIRYDDAPGAARDGYAERAFKLVTSAVSKLGGRVHKDPAIVCVDRPTLGPLAVRRSGRDLVFVAGPATLDKRSSVPAGDCALAKVWSQEVVH
jgi:hypothetical protein